MPRARPARPPAQTLRGRPARARAGSPAAARPTTKVRRAPAARMPATVAPPEVDVPRQRSAPSPLVVEPVVTPHRRRVRAAVWFGVAATVVIALASGSAVYAAGN